MTDDETESVAYDAMQRGDYDTALHLLRPLAVRGSVYALTTIGWIYEYGSPDNLDRDQAREYFEKAITLGSDEACLEMAWLLMRENKLSEARAILEKCKVKGGAAFDDVLKILANKETEFLAFEAIESEDYRKAFDVLEPYRDGDSPYALTTLGWLYQTGRGGIINRNLARSLFQRAAEAGCADAHYRIGLLELEQDNDEAARAAFVHGANKEHFPSITKLGEMMVEGRGGPVDFEQGMSFLKRTADQGHIMAKIALARAEENAESNMLKKVIIRIKSFRILKDAAKQAKKDINSPNIYEFR